MAATVLIRVDVETRDKLARMAEEDHTSIGDVAAAAAAKLERDRFWKAVKESYESLQTDPEAWAEYQAELRLWDAAGMDGLEDFPYDYDENDN